MGHGHKYEHECAYHRVVDFSVQANCLCVGSARRSGDALHDNKFHTLYVGNISLFSTPYTEKVFCFYYTVRAPCTFKAPVLRQTMATLFFFKNTPLGGAA